MPTPTTLQRIALFTVALIIASLVGRLGLIPDSEASLYWPAVGVIVLWSLRARRWGELGAFVVVTLVVLTMSNDQTGFTTGTAFVLALGNLATGLVTRWVAFSLVKVGRPLGLTSRSNTPPVSPSSYQETIARLAMPYDVFRLVMATFVGISVGTSITILVLPMDQSVPLFVEGAVLVVRNFASALLVAGTGLAVRQYGKDHHTAKFWELVSLFGLTTALAVVAHLLSPFIPMAMAVLLPLFWSGVRATTTFAALHAAYTSCVVLLLTGLNGGAVFGADSGQLPLSVRAHLFVILAVLISLVVSTAVNEFLRLNAELTEIADTAQRRAAELRTVTETIPDALLTIDKQGHATPLNAGAREFVVRAPEGHLELISPRPSDGVNVPQNAKPSSLALSGETVERFPFSYIDDAGEKRVFELNSAPLIAEGGHAHNRALLLIRDVTENHRLMHQLEITAESDPLTGLLNRRRFDRELAAQLDQFRRHSHGGGLLVLDLDGFKEINDTFGHAAGDMVLVGIARILSESLRSTDVTARLGGDEFAVMIPFADREQLGEVAELLLDRIRTFAQSLDGAGRALTASIGAATFTDTAEQGIDLLIAADMAMYEAKSLGRDAFVIFGDIDASRPTERSPSEWKKRLEQALDADELVLHLQPLLDVGSGRIVAAESLVRMIDDGELIPPSEFVPVAERSGLAASLDRWVVRTAVAMVGRLRVSEPDFSIWINVSAHSINNPGLEKTLLRSLSEHGVPPEAIVLELTETAKVDDVVSARTNAARLSDAGVRLAIDDFGTGYGSYLYLKHLLFNYVKIDGDFITTLDTSDTDRTIVRSIVTLATELGLQVVAEHVCSAEVLEAVRSEGIHFAQGYGIGRPCPEPEFVERYLPRQREQS